METGAPRTSDVLATSLDCWDQRHPAGRIAPSPAIAAAVEADERATTTAVAAERDRLLAERHEQLHRRPWRDAHLDPRSL